MTKREKTTFRVTGEGQREVLEDYRQKLFKYSDSIKTLWLDLLNKAQREQRNIVGDTGDDLPEITQAICGPSGSVIGYRRPHGGLNIRGFTSPNKHGDCFVKPVKTPRAQNYAESIYWQNAEKRLNQDYPKLSTIMHSFGFINTFRGYPTDGSEGSYSGALVTAWNSFDVSWFGSDTEIFVHAPHASNIIKQMKADTEKALADGGSEEWHKRYTFEEENWTVPEGFEAMLDEEYDFLLAKHKLEQAKMAA